MAFNFLDFERLAGNMASEQPPSADAWLDLSHARCRSAVSRVYYSVYRYSFSYLSVHCEDPHILIAHARLFEEVAGSGSGAAASQLRARATAAEPNKTSLLLEQEAEKKGMHGHVIGLLRKIGSIGREAADALNTLRQYRIAADYNPYALIDSASVKVACYEARRARTAVKKLIEDADAVKRKSKPQ